MRSASMSSPESVSSRIARLGSSSAICRISLRFFSPPEKPSLTLRSRKSGFISSSFIFSRTKSSNSSGSSSSLPRCGLHRVVGQPQKLAVGHTRYFDRILETEEHAGARARFRRQFEQIPAFEQHLAAGDFVGRMAGQHLGEGALARAVRPHDRVHFAALHREVDALENFDAVDGRAQPAHLEQGLAVLVNHPTLPSSLRPSSLVASTANSIGNC